VPSTWTSARAVRESTAPRVTTSSTNSTISTDAYRCSCKAGYGNGTCAHGFLSQYLSQCKITESESRAGYGGNCDMDVTACINSPCKDTAQCVDSTTASSGVTVNAYRCRCTPWPRHRRVQLCVHHAVQDAGHCGTEQQGHVQRQVTWTWTSARATICQNGAKCTHSAVANKIGHRSYSRVCGADYAGDCPVGSTSTAVRERTVPVRIDLVLDWGISVRIKVWVRGRRVQVHVQRAAQDTALGE
jgi:hypothetical protein